MLLEDITDVLNPPKPVQILLYLMEHTDDNKVFDRTYKQIQKDLNVSQPTIASTLKKLQSVGSIEHLGGSKWKINILDEFSDICDGMDLYVRHLGP